MEALDGASGEVRLAGAACAVGLSLLVTLATPMLMGPRLRRLAREGVGPGVRPRRQWAVSGVSVTLAVAGPLLLLAGGSPEVRAAGLVTAVAGAAGLLNDVLGLRRVVQLAMAVGVAWWGVWLGLRIGEVKPPFGERMVSLGAWGGPASMVWLLAVAYAVVLCRRLARLTAGVVTIASVTFAAAALVVAPSRSAPAGALTGLVLAAAAGGAWRRGFPALGSSAHWAMGFALGAITMVGMLKNTAFLVLAVPLLALGVPAGETTYAVIYGGERGRARLALGQRRELLHEGLMRMGLSQERTVALLQAATAYLCLVALALVALVRVSFVAKLGLLAVALGVGFVLFFAAARIAAAPRETGEERVDMFGVPIARINMEGALERIDRFVAERSPHMVVTSDSPGIVRARDDPEYQQIVRGADMVTADGRGVVWMARVLGLPVTERVSGVDLMARICERAAQRRYRVYLLGGRPGVAVDAARMLEARCPGLRVVGAQHGYFAPEQEPEVVGRIAEARPDILFVGFGAPKQEKWIRRHLEELGAPVAIGVGGSLDVFAGRVKRAPGWMQSLGLEWLWRVAREPRRLPRLWAIPRLMWMTLREALGRRRA